MRKKLLEFQKRVNTIKKDGKNPHFKSTYATLGQILGEVKPILSELGLLLTQPISGGMLHTTISDIESGDMITSSIQIPDNLNPQQLGSAITYYRRYLLASLLSLELEDDDANQATRPELTINQWTTALDRIKDGEKDLIVKLREKFHLTKEQEKTLKFYEDERIS